MTTYAGPLPFVKKCCCTPPCPPLSFCKCDNDNSDLPCLTFTFGGATAPDLLCADVDPGGGGWQYIMDLLEGEYTIACDSTLCIADGDAGFFACNAFGSPTTLRFYLTIKAFYDAGTSQLCLQIYVMCRDTGTIPPKWLRREAKVCWEFPVTTVDGCPYRSCTPSLLSTQFGCSIWSVDDFTDGIIGCDDLPSSEAISGTNTCADVMTGSYHMADLLPDLTTMTFGVTTTPCP